MKKILPVLLALMGLSAGIGGGIALRPAPVEMSDANPCSEIDQMHTASIGGRESMVGTETTSEPDYVKLNNQFVIPVVEEGAVAALVVISLSLEMTSGGPELVYKREPKLRDSFLQVLFNHANTGGFDGNFTTGRKMDQLRAALRESAIKTLGTSVTDVLIADVLRQDV